MDVDGSMDEDGSTDGDRRMDEEGSETVLDPHSVGKMMDLTGISALHARNISGRG